ncbi:hypothetical protein BESB_039150 [Besnoitia besnoiti]|uniref:Transmembrane protein n=1 Tax=Besnoitia besnoiti TaxID=94643 RepID=A0A2A9MNJ0_BESBE|nr:hypothetical protein BESB_039150 [Besnoitia besnoiti]PFH37457.1 hypothetical protein BESB_039150 [Besnoitia besnoiti]
MFVESNTSLRVLVVPVRLQGHTGFCTFFLRNTARDLGSRFEEMLRAELSGAQPGRRGRWRARYTRACLLALSATAIVSAVCSGRAETSASPQSSEARLDAAPATHWSPPFLSAASPASLLSSLLAAASEHGERQQAAQHGPAAAPSDDADAAQRPKGGESEKPDEGQEEPELPVHHPLFRLPSHVVGGASSFFLFWKKTSSPEPLPQAPPSHVMDAPAALALPSASSWFNWRSAPSQTGERGAAAEVEEQRTSQVGKQSAWWLPARENVSKLSGQDQQALGLSAAAASARFWFGAPPSLENVEEAAHAAAEGVRDASRRAGEAVHELVEAGEEPVKDAAKAVAHSEVAKGLWSYVAAAEGAANPLAAVRAAAWWFSERESEAEALVMSLADQGSQNVREATAVVSLAAQSWWHESGGQQATQFAQKALEGAAAWFRQQKRHLEELDASTAAAWLRSLQNPQPVPASPVAAEGRLVSANPTNAETQEGAAPSKSSWLQQWLWGGKAEATPAPKGVRKLDLVQAFLAPAELASWWNEREKNAPVAASWFWSKEAAAKTDSAKVNGVPPEAAAAAAAAAASWFWRSEPEGKQVPPPDAALTWFWRKQQEAVQDAAQMQAETKDAKHPGRLGASLSWASLWKGEVNNSAEEAAHQEAEHSAAASSLLSWWPATKPTADEKAKGLGSPPASESAWLWSNVKERQADAARQENGFVSWLNSWFSREGNPEKHSDKSAKDETATSAAASRGWFAVGSSSGQASQETSGQATPKDVSENSALSRFWLGASPSGDATETEPAAQESAEASSASSSALHKKPDLVSLAGPRAPGHDEESTSSSSESDSSSGSASSERASVFDLPPAPGDEPHDSASLEEPATQHASQWSVFSGTAPLHGPPFLGGGQSQRIPSGVPRVQKAGSLWSAGFSWLAGPGGVAPESAERASAPPASPASSVASAAAVASQLVAQHANAAAAGWMFAETPAGSEKAARSAPTAHEARVGGAHWWDWRSAGAAGTETMTRAPIYTRDVQLDCDPIPPFRACVQKCQRDNRSAKKAAASTSAADPEALGSYEYGNLRSCYFSCKQKWIDTDLPGCLREDGVKVEGVPPVEAFRITTTTSTTTTPPPPSPEQKKSPSSGEAPASRPFWARADEKAPEPEKQTEVKGFFSIFQRPETTTTSTTTVLPKGGFSVSRLFGFLPQAEPSGTRTEAAEASGSFPFSLRGGSQSLSSAGKTEAVSTPEPAAGSSLWARLFGRKVTAEPSELASVAGEAALTQPPQAGSPAQEAKPLSVLKKLGLLQSSAAAAEEASASSGWWSWRSKAESEPASDGSSANTAGASSAADASALAAAAVFDGAELSKVKAGAEKVKSSAREIVDDADQAVESAFFSWWPVLLIAVGVGLLILCVLGRRLGQWEGMAGSGDIERGEYASAPFFQSTAVSKHDDLAPSTGSSPAVASRCSDDNRQPLIAQVE